MTVSPSSWLRMVPAVFIMGTIFFLSHQPGDSLHLYPLPGIDKLAHFAVYGLLAGSILFAVKPSYRSIRPGLTAVMTVCFCLLYGVTDELHQFFVPLRQPDILDIVADSAGAATVCIAWYTLKMQRRGKMF